MTVAARVANRRAFGLTTVVAGDAQPTLIERWRRRRNLVPGEVADRAGRIRT